jgi:hypothetical protein
MKKFILKSLPFILIFSIIRVVPNVILTNFIFFRFWEYAHIDQEPPTLPRFTPNLNVTILEEGDINHGQTCSVAKSINWFTDKYGLRNQNNIRSSEYIFVGCSNVLGSNCEYLNTFSGIISENHKVYNIAPDYNLNFFQKIYCDEKPEKIKHIFLVQVARYFTYKDQFKYSKVPFDNEINGRYYNIVQRIKGNYFGNKIQSLFSIANLFSTDCNGQPHYYETLPETKFVSNNVKELYNRLEFFKIPTTIIVIPDKEFYRQEDTINKQVYFQIINDLNSFKMSTVNISSLFDQQCYFHGDGHINERGHKIIAKIINDRINSLKLHHTK